MKFVGSHSDWFKFPTFSFLVGFLQFMIVIFVEVASIWNLTYIGEIMDLVINYITVGVVQEFDILFFEMYSE